MNPSSVSHFPYLGEGCTVEFKRSGTSELERGKCVSANATWEVILVGSGGMMEKYVRLATING